MKQWQNSSPERVIQKQAPERTKRGADPQRGADVEPLSEIASRESSPLTVSEALLPLKLRRDGAGPLGFMVHSSVAGALTQLKVQRSIRSGLRSLERLQRASSAGGDVSGEVIQQAASVGVQSPSTTLPFLNRIQPLFGRHDLSQVQAHVGEEATSSAQAMNAQGYATGNHVVFAGSPDLHTVAHEAAHVIQQRGEVQLTTGVGQAGDVYEQHADAVADRVVSGQPAEDLLDRLAGGQTDVSSTGSSAGGESPSPADAGRTQAPRGEGRPQLKIGPGGSATGGVVQRLGSKFGYELQFSNWKLVDFGMNKPFDARSHAPKSEPLKFAGANPVVDVTNDDGDVELVTKALPLSDWKNSTSTLAKETFKTIDDITALSGPVKHPLDVGVLVRSDALILKDKAGYYFQVLQSGGVVDKNGIVVNGWEQKLEELFSNTLKSDFGIQRDKLTRLLGEYYKESLDGVPATSSLGRGTVIPRPPSPPMGRPQLTFGAQLVDLPALIHDLLEKEKVLNISRDRRNILKTTYDPKRIDPNSTKQGKLSHPDRGLAALIAGTAESVRTQDKPASMSKDTQVFMSRVSLGHLSADAKDLEGVKKHSSQLARLSGSDPDRPLIMSDAEREYLCIREALNKELENKTIEGIFTRVIGAVKVRMSKPVLKETNPSREVTFRDFQDKATDPKRASEYSASDFSSANDNVGAEEANIGRARDITGEKKLEATLVEIRKFAANQPLEEAIGALTHVAQILGEKHNQLQHDPGETEIVAKQAMGDPLVDKLKGLHQSLAPRQEKQEMHEGGELSSLPQGAKEQSVGGKDGSKEIVNGAKAALIKLNGVLKSISALAMLVGDKHASNEHLLIFQGKPDQWNNLKVIAKEHIQREELTRFEAVLDVADIRIHIEIMMDPKEADVRQKEFYEQEQKEKLLKEQQMKVMVEKQMEEQKQDEHEVNRKKYEAELSGIRSHAVYKSYLQKGIAPPNGDARTFVLEVMKLSTALGDNAIKFLIVTSIETAKQQRVWKAAFELNKGAANVSLMLNAYNIKDYRP